MNNSNTDVSSELQFTGEYFVPGKSGDRIEADHIERYKFAAQFVKEKSVLDVACGVGYAAPILINAGASCYRGGDIQQSLIDYATKKYGNDRANFQLIDITTPVDPEKYEVITCFETIEHVQSYRAALKNLYDALKPDGILLISSPNRIITSPRAKTLTDKPINIHHTQEFIPQELLEELRLAGFSVEENLVYGQRQRIHLNNKYFRKLLNLLEPDDNSSPEVSKVTWKTPRYFIVCARKPKR